MGLIDRFSGIDKTLYKIKDLLSDRFWITIANQNNGVFRQEEAPFKFNSQNEHWHNFIRLFETIAELNEWSDLVKAGKLILSMQGTAQKVALAQPVLI